MNTVNDNKELACVKMQGEMSDNLLTPGMTAEVVPGRAVVRHNACTVVPVFQYADAPYRPAGSVGLLRLADFVEYLKAYEGADGKVRIFVNRLHARAVLNADTWGDDLVDFDLARTPDWHAWEAKNATWMTQEDFCDFLEDQQRVIAEPCGVELLDLVANFRQKSTAEFSRSYRGSDGQTCVSYQEKNTGANRDLALPAYFKLHLPVVKGAEQMTTYELKARLKVRIDKDSHRLYLRYDLVRPDVPEDNAMADIAEHLLEQLPWADVFVGAIIKGRRQALLQAGSLN